MNSYKKTEDAELLCQMRDNQMTDEDAMGLLQLYQDDPYTIEEWQDVQSLADMLDIHRTDKYDGYDGYDIEVNHC